MNRGLNKNHKGFSLIEVVVSLVILGFLLTAILPMFVSGFSLIYIMGQKTKISNEAQAFIEAIYDKGIDEVDNIAASYSSTKVPNQADMNDLLYDTGAADKQMFYNVTESSNMNKVTVMLFYNKGKRSVKFSTLVP